MKEKDSCYHNLPDEFFDTSDVARFMVITLGMLHALRQHHQFAHWTLKGMNFYGEHLLFQRLYEEVIPGEIDSLAEKLLGTTDVSDQMLAPELITRVMQEFLKLSERVTAGPTRALHMELDFINFIEDNFTPLKESGQMSLGLDDLLMSIVNNHETHVFLLKQRLKECSMVKYAVRKLKASGNVDIDSSMILQSPNVHREVRDLATSRAITNDSSVMRNVLKNKNINREQKILLEETPPTPDETLEEYSYSDELGTLSRYLIERVAKAHLNRRKQ